MDCLELIIADHNRGRGLFKRWKAAHERDDVESMKLLTAKIAEELTIHMTIEEELFYPAVRGETDDIADTIYEGIEEHHVGKTVLQELVLLEPGTDVWTAKTKVLIEVTEHHMDEEEQDMLPKVRGATDGDCRERLGTKMANRKVQLGAPPVEKALDLTKAELDELARTQEIPGRSKMKKQELALTVDPRG